MSNVIQFNTKQLILSKRTIKNFLDEKHRQDWEDDRRFERQKQKALRYIPVRAKDFSGDWEQLVWEARRIFHDDLINDPDVKAAAQKACFGDSAKPPTEDETPRRGVVRGVSDHDNVIELLEWQKKEEDTTP